MLKMHKQTEKKICAIRNDLRNIAQLYTLLYILITQLKLKNAY